MKNHQCLCVKVCHTIRKPTFVSFAVRDLNNDLTYNILLYRIYIVQKFEACITQYDNFDGCIINGPQRHYLLNHIGKKMYIV
jgi:hypothetical protein